MSDLHTEYASAMWQPPMPVRDLMDQSQLQNAQDAAIMAAAQRHDEAEGLRVTAAAPSPDGESQRIEFSDGSHVVMTKQQVAALRSM